MRGRALAAALLLLVASTCARATIWERPLGPYGVFRLDLPSAWTAKLQEPDAAGGRAIAITPPTGVPLLLLVSTLPLPDNVADTLLEDGARSTVARLQSVAEEPALEAKWFEGAVSRGFYVSVTDKRVGEPTAQNFKYGIQGYRPKQLEYGTGGPKQVENLYTRAMLEDAFRGFRDIEIIEEDVEMREGTAHSGMSAVINFTARK